MKHLPTAPTAALPSDLDIDRLAFELAANHVGAKRPADEVAGEWGLTSEQFVALVDNDLFQRKTKGYAKQLREDGSSFRLKAQVLAEDLLGETYKLAKHIDTPPAVKEKLISNVVRWAGREVKVDGPGSGGSDGPKLSISINLGDATPGTRPETITIDVPVAPATPAIPATDEGDVSEH